METFKLSDQTHNDISLKNKVTDELTIRNAKLDICNALNDINKLITANINDIITTPWFNIDALESLGQCLSDMCKTASIKLQEKYQNNDRT